MDQPISCQGIHYIYKHPLSILIHLKFQDKDGCSKNGSSEFFKVVYKMIPQANLCKILSSHILDSRGVLLSVTSSKCVDGLSTEIEEKILRFSQLNINVRCKTRIVDEEMEALKFLLSSSSYFNYNDGSQDISDFMEDPSKVKGVPGVFCVNGAVIGFQPHFYQKILSFQFHNHDQEEEQDLNFRKLAF